MANCALYYSRVTSHRQQGHEAEVEALHEGPAVDLGEERGAGADVAQQQQRGHQHRGGQRGAGRGGRGGGGGGAWAAEQCECTLYSGQAVTNELPQSQ